MENKGKQKNNPRDDMSLDQAILQWIVDDYDIPDEKSRKIVGESGEKSKLITCKMVMDPENSVSNLSLGELGGKFETESLLYSRINISLDLPQEVLNASAVSKLKRITGGDSLEIQRKNQGSLKLDHNMKFLFATNFPLRIESSDPALFDRIIFLLFMNSVPKEERDPDLAKKLWKERDAIVTKALQYARDLMDQGWQFPPIPDVDCMRGVQRKSPMDHLREFLDAHCEMGDYNYFTSTADLRRAYRFLKSG